MTEVHDPKFIDALRQMFITRDEFRNILDYQQKLFSSLQELSSSHRAVHEHVRKLTESHNRVQDDTTELNRTRNEVVQSLRSLDSLHRQTQGDMREAISAINYMQQEIRKISKIEERLANLEREVKRLWEDDKKDDRAQKDQEQRLKKVENKRNFL